nr:MAG TPA: hypothetical protein [Caudoviricetes sp.]
MERKKKQRLSKALKVALARFQRRKWHRLMHLTCRELNGQSHCRGITLRWVRPPSA